jgi:hypothetical protein
MSYFKKYLQIIQESLYLESLDEKTIKEIKEKLSENLAIGAEPNVTNDQINYYIKLEDFEGSFDILNRLKWYMGPGAVYYHYIIIKGNKNKFYYFRITSDGVSSYDDDDKSDEAKMFYPNSISGFSVEDISQTKIADIKEIQPTEIITIKGTKPKDVKTLQEEVKTLKDVKDAIVKIYNDLNKKNVKKNTIF